MEIEIKSDSKKVRVGVFYGTNLSQISYTVDKQTTTINMPLDMLVKMAEEIMLNNKKVVSVSKLEKHDK